jgi:hypothetical protein
MTSLPATITDPIDLVVGERPDGVHRASASHNDDSAGCPLYHLWLSISCHMSWQCTQADRGLRHD